PLARDAQISLATGLLQKSSANGASSTPASRRRIVELAPRRADGHAEKTATVSDAGLLVSGDHGSANSTTTLLSAGERSSACSTPSGGTGRVMSGSSHDLSALASIWAAR